MNGLNKLKKEYMYDGEKSYLVVSIPVQDEIKNYQLEMLERNNIEPLLPLTVQRFNDMQRLYYEITSKIPIERIFERRRISAEELEYIVMQFARLPNELKDFLLDISFVILDKSYIYCDPLTMKLYFLYIPVPACENEPDRFKQFIKRMIIDDINLMDDSSGNLLKRLLDVLKLEEFNTEKLVQSIGASETVRKEETVKKPEKEETAERQAGYQVKEPNHIIREPNKKHGSAAKFTYPLSSYLVTASLNVVMVVLLILVLAAGNSGDAGSKVLGITLVAVAANYFAVTRLFAKDKRIQKSVDKTYIGNRYVNKSIKNIPKTTNYYANTLAKSETAAGKAINDNNEYYETIDKPSGIYPMNEKPIRTKMNSTDSCRTMILGERTGNTPVLQSFSDPSERIIIDKSSIIIGRLRGSVDHVIDNMAVGKIHAEIVKKGNEFYIIDLNSVNGTFVNGERIVCNTETMIKNGDKITFANEAYTFTV